MISTVLQTTMFLLREGVEAFLLVTAIRACLSNSGAANKGYAIYLGAALAIVAALLLIWSLGDLYVSLQHSLSGAISLLLIAGLMLRISGWLFVGSSEAFGSRQIGARIARISRTTSVVWLGALAFAVVFREACETALFLYALARAPDVQQSGITYGLVAGTACLVIACVVLGKVFNKLPLKLIFLSTSAFLFVSAVLLVGTGLSDLQSLGYLSRTIIRGSQWLSALGLNPSLEVLLAQAAIIAVSGAGFAHASNAHRGERRSLARPRKAD